MLQACRDRISLLAGRPPRSTGHAQRIAAEHFAFCDECAGQGLSDIPRITASLTGRDAELELITAAVA